MVVGVVTNGSKNVTKTVFGTVVVADGVVDVEVVGRGILEKIQLVDVFDGTRTHADQGLRGGN